MNALEMGSFDVEEYFTEFWQHQRLLVNEKVEHSELLQNPDKWQKFSINKNEMFVKGAENKKLFN
jgi:hypothetical protein